MTPLDIRGICLAGGSVVVSALQYTPFDLRGFAIAAGGHGGKVLIKNASKLSALTCRSISSAGGAGTVTFDFTE